jgi:hypothetical protein
VDAYFPLSTIDHPSASELRDAWSHIISNLEKLSETWQRAIIFTEIGYQSRLGASRTPWGVNAKNIDLQEQADCYQSVFEALSGFQWWRGVFWWNWSIDSNQGGIHDGGYTANNKPAEDILRFNYGAPPRQDSSTLLLPPVYEGNPLIIYQSSPGPGWQNWSWSTTINHQDNIKSPDGQPATSLALYGWGGFSLHHNGIDTTPFYYVGIQIFISANTYPSLIAYFHDQTDKPINLDVTIFEPRYIQGNIFTPSRWLTIRIPLIELDAISRTISRFNLKNNSDALHDIFLLGDIKLLGSLHELI